VPGKRRARQKGIHFFNPAQVQRLVELIPALTTVEETVELDCAHPMGPLKLADLIGLDTVAAIADPTYEEFRDPSHAAPPLLRRMVAAGHLGRKSGAGFYAYA
jgi:3-hydroxyacyl-CoA dehydrogenase